MSVVGISQIGVLQNKLQSCQILIARSDFDHPIRDRLPPGFGVAMKFIKVPCLL